jgi:hypothetical protein
VARELQAERPVRDHRAQHLVGLLNREGKLERGVMAEFRRGEQVREAICGALDCATRRRSTSSTA